MTLPLILLKNYYYFYNNSLHVTASSQALQRVMMVCWENRRDVPLSVLTSVINLIFNENLVCFQRICLSSQITVPNSFTYCKRHMQAKYCPPFQNTTSVLPLPYKEQQTLQTGAQTLLATLSWHISQIPSSKRTSTEQQIYYLNNNLYQWLYSLT